jgi:hypothetical protein
MKSMTAGININGLVASYLTSKITNWSRKIGETEEALMIRWVMPRRTARPGLLTTHAAFEKNTSSIILITSGRASFGDSDFAPMFATVYLMFPVVIMTVAFSNIAVNESLLML